MEADFGNDTFLVAVYSPPLNRLKFDQVDFGAHEPLFIPPRVFNLNLH